MSTFHYLPSSCELDTRFQAINFQNPEVEKMAKELRGPLRKHIKENKPMHIYCNGDDQIEDIKDDFIAQRGEWKTFSIPYAVTSLTDALHNHEMRGVCADKIAHYEARMYFKYCGKHYELPYCICDTSPNGNSIYNPVEITMHDGFLRAVKGEVKDYKLRKRIFICVGGTGYSSNIIEMCEALHSETLIRMAAISEYEILKDAGTELGAINIGCNDEYNNKAVEEFRNSMKNGEGYVNLLKMYIDMFLRDTVTSALFIHCISTFTMTSVVSIAANCMDMYCTNCNLDKDPYNVCLIKQCSLGLSEEDERRLIDAHSLYGCKIFNINDESTCIYTAFHYDDLVNDIKSNLYQVPKKQEEKSEDDGKPKTFAEEYPEINSDTYNMVYSIAADIMEVYDLYSNRGDFFEEVQKVLYKRTKTAVSIQ